MYLKLIKYDKTSFPSTKEHNQVDLTGILEYLLLEAKLVELLQHV